MKKALSLILVAMMIMVIALPAFAADETGSITINGVSTENTYEIYKLLDLESYDKTSGAYSYKVNSAWTGFFATSEALTYVAIDEAGYVTWIATEDADVVAAFAKLALAYAQANSISPVKSSKNSGEFVITGTSGKFSDLSLGYYLIDSTMGALCGLTTTNPDASINAKNAAPTVSKQVLEDSTTQWDVVNTADIGQTVEFRVTISVHAGAENYILHDVMASGLTFNNVTKVEHVIPGSGTHTMETDLYTVNTTGIADGCTFEVVFSKEACDELETNDKIVVYYTAMLNRNAVIAGDGNTNTAWLTFGANSAHKSNESTVVTKTFGIDIIKTDSQNTLIDGAQFRIYDTETGGTEIGVVLMDDGVTYRRARADEVGVAIIVKDGKVRVVGFDNGVYYLEETISPAGYNKLTARQRFIISDGNLDAIFNDGTYSTGSGVHVVNKTGSMLPETGGLGTTLFIAVGTIMVLGAAVVLFAKKRMSQIEA